MDDVFTYSLLLHVLHFVLFYYANKNVNIDMSNPPKMNTYARTFYNMTCLGSHEVRKDRLEPLSLMIQMVKSLYFSIAPKFSIGLDITLLGGKICV